MMRRFLSALGLGTLLAMTTQSVAFASDLKIVPTIPLQGDHVRTARPTIAFQIHSGDQTNSVPQSAVRLYVDGAEVTDQLAVEGANLAYVPQQPLSLSTHEVRVAVDDGSGGSIGYSWTFTIDADDTPAPADAQPYENQPYGTLTPLADQYGYGDDAGFYFSGVPGGYGYLTFAGFPGFYPLVPLYGNVYYAAFPVPYGYYSNAPGVVCHFSGPGGSTNTFIPTRPVAFVPQFGPSGRRYVEGAHSGRAFAPTGHAVPVFAAPSGNANGTGSTVIAPGHALRVISPISAHPTVINGVTVQTNPFHGNSRANEGATVTAPASGTTTVVVPAPTVPSTTRGYVPPNGYIPPATIRYTPQYRMPQTLQPNGTPTIYAQPMAPVQSRAFTPARMPAPPPAIHVTAPAPAVHISAPAPASHSTR